MITLHNGLKMPQLGLGTFRITDPKEAYDTVRTALEIGYRHIDTAQFYKNEEMIGQAIKDSKIPREEIFITTKYWGFHDEDEMEEKFKESLEKLQTDYIDLYLIHWPSHTRSENIRVWRHFEKLYEAKKVLAIGVSNFQKHHLSELIEDAKIVPMINQVELHPGLSQVALNNFLKSHKIQIMSYGPLMRGRVFETPYYDTLDMVAHRHNATIAQVVIAWGLHRNVVMIPKSVTKSRLEENFKAKDLKLSNKEIDVINELNRGQRVYTDPDNVPWGY